MPHPTLHRGKQRLPEGHGDTTRLVGAGWTWECDCGEKGAWHSKREEALEQARVHKLFKHGQR